MSEVEQVITNCPYCRNKVVSLWAVGGGCYSSNDYTLVADWIFHSRCWDKMIEEFPPDGASQEEATEDRSVGMSDVQAVEEPTVLETREDEA